MGSAGKAMGRFVQNWTSPALGLVVAFAAFAALVGLLPGTAAGAPTPPLTGLDLSVYHLVGRFGLPEPTRTAAPAGSLLAQEASSVTYDWDTDTLFVVGD